MGNNADTFFKHNSDLSSMFKTDTLGNEEMAP